MFEVVFANLKSRNTKSLVVEKCLSLSPSLAAGGAIAPVSQVVQQHPGRRPKGENRLLFSFVLLFSFFTFRCFFFFFFFFLRVVLLKAFSCGLGMCCCAFRKQLEQETCVCERLKRGMKLKLVE